MENPAPVPGILRRLVSMLYESLLLLALLFIAAFIFLAATHSHQSTLLRLAFQVYLLLVGGLYFVGFWLRGGQTLAMKTWHLRVERRDGGSLTPRQACLRYLLAVVGVFLGFGIIWAIFDRDRQFWHDRLAGTRIVQIAPS
ncbi:MAG: RDD family protein [Sulfuricella sp.]|nr:RDD family protein [Sulfuricella sp.]